MGKQVYRSLALITQFGLNMLVPTLMMMALGIYLDDRLGTSFLSVVLFFAGAIAGFQNIFRMAKSIYETKEERKEDIDELSRTEVEKCIDEVTDQKD